MKLVAFTVKNYRSITKAHKLPLGQTTVLLGRNNEGKSNILRALVCGLEVIRRGRGAIMRTTPQGTRRIFMLPPFDRRALYNWERDFPIGLQAGQPNGYSELLLEFELNPAERASFLTEIGSKLNHNLPVRIRLGKEHFSVEIAKQGLGAARLTRKASDIAEFIRRRLDFLYIPAIRRAEEAHEVVDRMLADALASVEQDPNYAAALQTIAAIQKPILQSISASIQKTLVQFLPAIREVDVQIASEARLRALRTSSEIVVDDGTPTPLKSKGDGVQSLAAIALMRYAASKDSHAQYSVVALEEPESHLHPKAIHELRAVLNELSKKQQIVITTHCPLFVDRQQIEANIIVDRNKATGATSIEEIRTVLGVRAADNLRHAELVLLVEGSEDVTALRSLLPHHSPKIRAAITEHRLVLLPIGGAGNLAYQLSQLQASLCEYHCYLDDDDAGRRSYADAEKDGLIDMARCHFTKCSGMTDAESEDTYDPDVYRTALETKFGVVLNVKHFKGNKKWSDRLKDTFINQGKPWTDAVKASAKAIVAAEVAAHPDTALNKHKRNSFDALVQRLQTLLSGQAQPVKKRKVKP